ncbi:LexA repressor-like protein [Paenibacillus larvae subsp. larvae DSM 25430]|nr:LexA repressor-like protein [Paenibacillus larvae subsp. larvae DSM 25430]
MAPFIFWNLAFYTIIRTQLDDALKEHPLYIKTNKKERLSSLKIPLLLPTTMTTF